jgi:hypothetical protein
MSFETIKLSIKVIKSPINCTYRLDANGLPKYLTQLVLAEWDQKQKISKADETEQHLGREMGKAVLGKGPKAADASSSSSNTDGKKKKDEK